MNTDQCKNLVVPSVIDTLKFANIYCWNTSLHTLERFPIHCRLSVLKHNLIVTKLLEIHCNYHPILGSQKSRKLYSLSMPSQHYIIAIHVWLFQGVFGVFKKYEVPQTHEIAHVVMLGIFPMVQEVDIGQQPKKLTTYALSI